MSANAPDGSFQDEALPQMDAVYRFALSLARDPDRAQDLTQETFLRAFRNWDKYTPGTRIKSWLFTICRNHFLQREERTRRHDEIVADAAEEDPNRISREATVFLAARGRDPEGEFWSRIVDGEVLRAIDELPDEFRDVVTLSDLEELPYQEIAEILEVPVGTVKSRLYRGRRRLQHELYDYAVEQGIIGRSTQSSSADAKDPST
ncbi:MAG: sigma-70 family RNA polymerase sigma factor [Gemmatimonadota bacterium]|nr:sigma-70 family RNA polymerase sigma factor [Gemmatimonadota bacterium]